MMKKTLIALVGALSIVNFGNTQANDRSYWPMMPRPSGIGVLEAPKNTLMPVGDPADYHLIGLPHIFDWGNDELETAAQVVTELLERASPAGNLIQEWKHRNPGRVPAFVFSSGDDVEVPMAVSTEGNHIETIQVTAYFSSFDENGTWLLGLPHRDITPEDIEKINKIMENLEIYVRDGDGLDGNGPILKVKDFEQAILAEQHPDPEH